jgi:hypothetical protein
MSQKASETELSKLHNELASLLKQAIQPEPVLDREGEVVGTKINAAALNVARQFLKDNNITSTLDSKPMRELVADLPSFEDSSSFGQIRIN